MIKWLINACPFAPGIAKPASIPRPNLPRFSLRARVLNWKTITLGLAMVTMMAMYIYNYPYLEFSGKPFLFEDFYFLKMSMYTYVASMVGHFIREYKKKQRKN